MPVYSDNMCVAA